MYTVYFMRGNIYEVEAISVKEAFKKLYKEYPECNGWDVLKVIHEGEEV